MYDKLFHLLMTPITPAFGVMLLAAGLYSLCVNRPVAFHKNHPRSEKLCRIGGWVYIVAGVAVIILSWRKIY